MDPQVIEDVKNTRDGLQVKLYSKEWAWNTLGKVLGFPGNDNPPSVIAPVVMDEGEVIKRWAEGLPDEILRDIAKLSDS